MIVDIYWYVKCRLKRILFKLIYGKKIKTSGKWTFRNRLNIMIKGGLLELGEDVFFNNDCSLNVIDHVCIGDKCIFGENVKIYDHNHKFNMKDIPIKEQPLISKEVIIGNNVWIGSNVLILAGSKIGNNTVIAAGCVVSGEVNSDTIMKRDNIVETITYDNANEKNKGCVKFD